MQGAQHGTQQLRFAVDIKNITQLPKADRNICLLELCREQHLLQRGSSSAPDSSRRKNGLQTVLT
jgi:hypothetical protein